MEYLLLLALVLCVHDGISLRFAKVYTNHMVLQRGPQRATVWGYADVVGDTVSLSKNHVNVGSAVVVTNPHAASPAGIWKIKLPAETSPGPFILTAQSSDGNVTLRDVLFGDVWLCSGQSNMAFTMAHVNNSVEEIASALNHSTIRTLLVKFGQSGVPLHEPVAQDGWVRPLHHHIEFFSAVCFLTALEIQKHTNHPIGLIEASVGGTKIELWSRPATLNHCNVSNTHAGRAVNKTATSSLWNAMVQPLVNITMKGALWYQGEANSRDPDLYRCLLTEMYLDWGRVFHEGSDGETPSPIPFGIVQLSGTHGNIIGGFPQLRWSQTHDYGYLPNKDMPTAFLAVAMDLSDPDSPYGSIHPRYKQDVAYRLSLGARVVAYGESGITFQGPFPNGYTLHPVSKELIIEFDTNLNVKNNHGFDVCCSHDPKGTCTLYLWTEAPIKSNTTNTVTVDVSVCHGYKSHVTGVRYAWRQTPCTFKGCALYGDTELPVPSFIENDVHTINPSIIG